MKIGLRADSSWETGTGHVMRQLTLAEELLSRKIDVTLFGNVSGPSWLLSRVKALSGLTHKEISFGSFNSQELLREGVSRVFVDSYDFNQANLTSWEASFERTIVIIDGPAQKLMGQVAVCPVLDESATWLAQKRLDFDSVYSGPSYAFIRKEFRDLKQRGANPHPPEWDILISLGGADGGHFTKRVLEALETKFSGLRIVIMEPGSPLAATQSSNGSNTVVRKPSGAELLKQIVRSRVVISALGTMALEMIYLDLPSIFVPVAENQRENAMATELLGLGVVVDPFDPLFEDRLRDAVQEALKTQGSRASRNSGSIEIDGLGVKRVADIIIEDP